VGLAAWARPTVFQGDTAEIGDLAALAGRHRLPLPARWWRRLRGEPAELPFGRLHTVLCRDRTPPPEVAPWARLGVRLMGSVPDLAAPRQAGQ